MKLLALILNRRANAVDSFLLVLLGGLFKDLDKRCSVELHLAFANIGSTFRADRSHFVTKYVFHADFAKRVLVGTHVTARTLGVVEILKAKRTALHNI